MCATGGDDRLQGDVPWYRESVRIAERPVSIGVPAAGVAGCFGRGESTDDLSRKDREVFSFEQAQGFVTIFDPVFTQGDARYLREYAGYVVPSVRMIQHQVR